MCGRFSLFTPPDDLGERFDVAVPEDYRRRYNVAPGQSIATIATDAPDSLQYRTWGLVPRWADEPDGGLINARAETIEEKPSFRTAVASRRCLVPADGFYEWTGDRGARQPYRIAFEDDRPFAMAGIWERWEGQPAQTGLDAFTEATDGDGDAGDARETEVHESVAIVTTEAIGPVADLHDRMPVILPLGEERSWLEAEDARRRAELLGPFEHPAFDAHRVSTAVNDASVDYPGLIEPVEG